MLYRKLGSTGLRTSALALGTGGLQFIAHDTVREIFARAYAAGVNHFDTAESYGGGQNEETLGQVLRALGVGREKYILATKAFTYGWSDPTAAPHEIRTLNRKYLLHAIDRSLKRLGTDFVDLYYCHQADPQTSVEEIAGAMNDIVQSGRARYWAVSNWDGELLGSACKYADGFGRHHPIVNQIEYNILHRATVKATIDEARARGVGLVAWGPLAGGLLSGKYLKGIPEKSRADTLPPEIGIKDRLIDKHRNALVAELAAIATDLGCTVGQLAIAWCLVQPQVSAAITFASSVAQLDENLGAITAVDKMTPEVLTRITDLVGDYDQSNIPEDLPKS